MKRNNTIFLPTNNYPLAFQIEGFNVFYLHKGEKSLVYVKRSSEWMEQGRGTETWTMTDKH